MEVEEKYWDLIAKYLSDKLSLEEKAVLFSWLEERPENQQLLEELQGAWSESAQYAEDFSVDTSTAWSEVVKELNLLPEEKPIRSLTGSWMRIAATITLLFLVSWFIIYQFNQPKFIEIVADDQHIKEVILPDGSKISLNKNSTLAYQSEMNTQKIRKVKLSGEAFFEVKHLKNQPFIIASQGTETQVLGTSFNVKSIKGEKEIKVSVVTGRVSFAKKGWFNDQQVFLEAGTEGILDINSSSLTKKNFEAPNFLFWRDKKLRFSNVPVSQILEQLQLYYHAQFRLADAHLASQNITASFQGEDVEEVLPILEALLDVKIIKSQDYYIVQPIK